MNNKCLSAWLLLSLLGLMLQALAQDAPAREITNITGDLYRVTDNAHRTAFLLTPEGIILTDPISVDFSTWLKAELDERYDVPVRYVLYSHHHDDHASGGAVFADTAIFVGHENMNSNLARESDNPIFKDVRPPDVTFTDRIAVTLGGKTVEMIHALPSHSDDSAIIRFLDERTIFAVDFVNVGRVPFENMGGGPVAPWIAANMHMQATVDYDIATLGHGPVGNKADVGDSTRYLEVLLAEVTAGIEAGRSLEEMQETILMEDFSHYINYDLWREQNIQGTYQGLMGE
jgi:glyoxylase-like metal-dependent hydrolase (beta-lactamase superfamily II)